VLIRTNFHGAITVPHAGQLARWIDLEVEEWRWLEWLEFLCDA
jgi:hypothetical protein